MVTKCLHQFIGLRLREDLRGYQEAYILTRVSTPKMATVTVTRGMLLEQIHKTIQTKKSGQWRTKWSTVMRHFLISPKGEPSKFWIWCTYFYWTRTLHMLHLAVLPKDLTSRRGWLNCRSWTVAHGTTFHCVIFEKSPNVLLKCVVQALCNIRM